MTTSYLSATQVDALLRPIDRGRVQRTQGFNHLEQHDVRRWLTRIFGFGRWSMSVDDVTLIGEVARVSDQGEMSGKFDVIYRATVTLTVFAPDGTKLADYTDVGTGDSQNTPLIGAHDLALKSAVSGAMKRAAVSLGDQFGLSLYWDGKDAFTAKVMRVAVPGLETKRSTGDVHDVEDTPVTTTEPENAQPEEAAPEEAAPDETPEPQPEAEPEPEAEQPVEVDDDPDARRDEMATALVRLAGNPNKRERSQALTKMSLTIGKEGWATQMTNYGVVMGVLVDRAFEGTVTDG